MAKSDSLFQLIKSMTKAEKRFLKLNSTRYVSKKDKDYIRLFDAIDVQKVYDEDSIRAKFKNEPYFDQLGVVKNYLRRQIIKALKNFDEETTSGFVFANYMLEIEVLFNRQLFGDCLDTIKKAKAYARKYEKLAGLLDLIIWESAVATSTNDLELVELRKKEQLKEANVAIEKYNELINAHQVGLESQSFLIQKGMARTTEEKQFIRQLLSNRALTGPAKSFRGELRKLTVKLMCSHLLESQLGDHVNALKGVELFEANPHYMYDMCNYYFNFLHYAADLSLTLKKIKLAEDLVQRLKIFYDQTHQRLDLKNKIRLVQLDAFLLIEQGEFARAAALVPIMKDMVLTSTTTPSPIEEIYFYLIYASIYFRDQDYKNTQYYVQKIINSGSSIRVDYHTMARIVNIIVQYELGEYEHLGYVLRSTYRFLMNKERLQQPENIFLAFIRKAIRLNAKEALLPALVELREDLLPYKDTLLVQDFSIIEWIDSKLQNVSLASIARKNYEALIEKEKTDGAVA